MGIVVITAAAVLCAAAVLFIPFTYHVSIRTGRPFRLCVRAGWFGRALAGTWDYTWSQRPVSSVYIGWKRQAGPPPDLSEDTAEKGADQAAEAVRQQAETDSAVTYESLKREDDGKAPKAAGFHWKPLVFNRDFAAAFFCWLGRILHHSRVARWTSAASSAWDSLTKRASWPARCTPSSRTLSAACASTTWKNGTTARYAAAGPCIRRRCCGIRRSL